MPRRPYPLDALRRLRDQRTEEQALSLAQQLARSRSAEQVARERSAACRSHAAGVDACHEHERTELERGLLSGADLLRNVEFSVAAAAQAAQLRAAEAKAHSALEDERKRQAQAQRELARREADAKLVHQHARAFATAEAETAERADEEAALEQWNARQR
jgi:hypothetical protein